MVYGSQYTAQTVELSEAHVEADAWEGFYE